MRRKAGWKTVRGILAAGRGHFLFQSVSMLVCFILMTTGSVQAGIRDRWEEKVQQHNNEEVTGQERTGSEQVPVQLTADDIEAMNGGDVTMLFSDEGFLTFLRGKYYMEKVENEEDGVRSIQGIASLLGLSKGSEFFCVYKEADRFGYSFYTYKQRYGDLTLQNAMLRIVVDPEGYTAGVVSSFQPNVGIAPKEESSITALQAEDVVRRRYPQYDLKFYSDLTRQTSVTIDGVAYHAWAVFTDYPKEAGVPEGRHYLEHLISYQGSYLAYMAVASPEELVLGDNVQEQLALAWFEGMEGDTWTGEVRLHDGTVKEITVPVAREPDTGLWYLADVERHILLSDCFTYLSSYELLPIESEENGGWPEHYLIAYDTYIKVYDFYDGYGQHSIDGFGMPLLLLYDYCDKSGTPVDNAAFLGISAGWGLFGLSAVNDYGECVDVIGHEFTHGVTGYTLAGDVYENEPGAVDEALSDIMGNLCEIMLGETDDEDWLMAENCGDPVRSMSFPWLGRQPVTVGGDFYQEPAEVPSMENDFGGVHTNSSLIGHLAWKMVSMGIGLEEAFGLWKEAVNLLTPVSGFREVHHALIFAAEIRQMDVAYMGMIDMICEEAGF